MGNSIYNFKKCFKKFNNSKLCSEKTEATTAFLSKMKLVRPSFRIELYLSLVTLMECKLNLIMKAQCILHNIGKHIFLARYQVTRRISVMQTGKLLSQEQLQAEPRVSSDKQKWTNSPSWNLLKKKKLITCLKKHIPMEPRFIQIHKWVMY